MRVLFLNYEYPPIGGGGANANAYLFREFSSHASLQIDCITSSPSGEDVQEQVGERIRLYRLAVGKRRLHYWRQIEIIRYLARASRLVKTLCRQQDYQLCHAFFGFPSGLLAWQMRTEIPYLVSLRGSDVPGFNPRFSLQYRVLTPLFRYIWRGADFTVANSIGLRCLALKTTPELDIRVIPNGIDTGQFCPVENSAKVPGLIVCVSRLIERKGVQHLIEAMPEIIRRIPFAHLRIVGDGDLSDRLRARSLELGLGEKVVFHGYLDHDELARHYRQAEIFVQPSFYEGMSNTVLEAMASGLPIVATAEGGREELLQQNALLAPYGDPSKLAETIVELLNSREKRESLGAFSRQVTERFSWSEVAGRYLDLYQAMLDSRPGHGRRGTAR